MRIIKKYTSLLLAVLIVFAAVSACSSPVGGGVEQAYPVYTDFRDIPGVTRDEISAIEEISSRYPELIYGMRPSPEAFVGEDGLIQGFTVIFCDWLTELFGIRFTPVVKDWDELQNGIAAGEVHFTGELSPSAELLKTHYMTGAIAERSIKAFKLQGAEDLGSISAQRKLRLAFLTGSNTMDLIARAAKYEFSACWVSSGREAMEKLVSGEIDAFLTDSAAEEVFAAYGAVEVKNFFPLVYTPVSLSTMSGELEPIITVLQKYLDTDAIYHLIDMYNTGGDEYFKHRLFLMLTAEEKQYIERRVSEGVPILVATETETYPASFYNNQENEWQGIAHDVLAEISRLTGLDFEPANEPGAAWYSLLAMLEDGRADIITELIRSVEREGRFLWADEAYCSDKYALLSTVEREDININQVPYLRVGVIFESAYADVFAEWFPNHSNTVVYMGTSEAFAALERGEIDVLMAAQNLLLSVTNYLEQPGFKTNLVFDMVYESSFGLNKEQDLLRSIVSKAQKLVDIGGISERWTRRVFDYRATLNRTRIPLLAGISVAASLAAGLAIALFLRNRRAKLLLEETVERRTAELQVQTEAAQVASRAKGEFLARMSHEIRTPLNAVIGMAHVIKQSAVNPEKTSRSADEILTASNHLMGIINDVLDLSKIESGKLELITEPFDLREAMCEIASLMNPRCAENGLIFSTNTAALPGMPVVGDKLRLKQVIINLVGNAVKFTPQYGNVVFNADIQSEESSKICLRFTVSDDGIGIDEDRIPGLFEPFEQADGSIASRFGGTGLGLSISRTLVRAMGGDIAVSSIPGEGSVFSFEVTFQKCGEAQAPRKSAELAETPDLTGKRILLAEDIEINRLILCELLADTGAEIDEAPDGEAAVHMLATSSENYYDLIFMDIQMPKTDGYEATRLIRRMNRPDAGKIPIIAMTANAYREDYERAIDAGMNDHLSKPIDITAIRAMLAEYLLKPGAFSDT